MEIRNISVRHIYLQNRFLGENLQFKPTNSDSAYFLTTTKLDQNMKQIELYSQIVKFGDERNVT